MFRRFRLPTTFLSGASDVQASPFVGIDFCRGVWWSDAVFRTSVIFYTSAIFHKCAIFHKKMEG